MRLIKLQDSRIAGYKEFGDVMILIDVETGEYVTHTVEALCQLLQLADGRLVTTRNTKGGVTGNDNIMQYLQVWSNGSADSRRGLDDSV
jgi:hypothetical protein